MITAFQRTGKSRADLVRLITAFSSEAREERTLAAAAIGFVREREADPEIEAFEINEQTSAWVEGKTISTPVDGPAAVVEMPLWRLETMTFAEEPARPEPAPEREETRGLTHEDLHGTGQSLFATPKAPSLAPWSRLWPMLRQALHSTVPSREPDMAAWVRLVSRGEMVTRIPRLSRRAWPTRVSIWIDRAKRLLPFWSDQMEVCRRLYKVCDRRGIGVRWLDTRTQMFSLRRRSDFLAKFHADSATPILVLGDLGWFGTDEDRAAWRSTGLRLRRFDVRLSALVPSCPARWTASLARTWNALSWERGRTRGVMGLARNATTWQERAERLLKWVSPAAYVQPGLLRAIRLLLPPWQVDASTEVDVWNHGDVRAADVAGWTLQPDAAERYRQAFAIENDTALKERVSQTIALWHKQLPRELLRAETLVWFAVAPDVKPPGDLQEALDFAARLEGSALASGDDPQFADIVKRYGHALLSGMPDAIYEKLPALQTVWVASFQGVPVPTGIDPVAIRAKLERAGETMHWCVRQVGERLVFAPNERGGEWPSYVEGPGSPMAWFVAARPWITVVRGKTVTTYRLEHGLSIPLEGEQGLELRTDRCTIGIRLWRRESWAKAAGRDRFGLWADADIKGVVQRFRWIPPGRFLMGSPEDEMGRYDDEGPQHEVTWTQGRWLGDTPVTQGLWTAVTGFNPSDFQSEKHSTDDRPVEQVNWYDCVTFVENIGMSLPSEAEWEYACRGGTTMATWAGELEFLADDDVPVLDEIAWYRGNNGVNFDLDEGYDTTKWRQKQYEFDRGGTNPVRRKASNPFGLYDMLGNVAEWCRDSAHSYTGDSVTDPVAMATANAADTRILRGGCWYGPVTRVRAARRGADLPKFGSDYIGFRLARDAEIDGGKKKGDR